MDLLDFLLQRFVHHSVSLDQHLIIERVADDRNLEMRFRAGCDVMHMAFIFYLQELGIEFVGKFLFDDALY
jgi:hypothetical protein